MATDEETNDAFELPEFSSKIPKNYTADFLYDDGREEAVAGNCHYCPKNHSHSMINNGTEDLVFFAVVAEQ